MPDEAMSLGTHTGEGSSCQKALSYYTQLLSNPILSLCTHWGQDERASSFVFIPYLTTSRLKGEPLGHATSKISVPMVDIVSTLNFSNS